MASAPKSKASAATFAYLVLVGSVVTGPSDDRVEVGPGNTVDLTADDAAPLIARGILAPSTDAAAPAAPAAAAPVPAGDAGLAAGDGQQQPQT